jgi:hypothetical protein
MSSRQTPVVTDSTGVLRTVNGWFTVTQFASFPTLSFDLDASHEVKPNALDQKIMREAAANLSTLESPPSQLHFMFLGGAFYRDVPERGPLVDLAIPLRIFRNGLVSVEMDAARNHPPVASSLPVVLYGNETSRIDLPHR